MHSMVGPDEAIQIQTQEVLHDSTNYTAIRCRIQTIDFPYSDTFFVDQMWVWIFAEISFVRQFKFSPWISILISAGKLKNWMKNQYLWKSSLAWIGSASLLWLELLLKMMLRKVLRKWKRIYIAFLIDLFFEASKRSDSLKFKCLKFKCFPIPGSCQGVTDTDVRLTVS